MTGDRGERVAWAVLDDPSPFAITEYSFGRAPIIVDSALPVVPSPGEDARRLVRHLFGAEFMAWVGLPLGPEPGAVTHMVWVGRGPVFVSPEWYDRFLAVDTDAKHGIP